jgi:hypothetical protein
MLVVVLCDVRFTIANTFAILKATFLEEWLSPSSRNKDVARWFILALGICKPFNQKQFQTLKQELFLHLIAASNTDSQTHFSMTYDAIWYSHSSVQSHSDL